MVGAYLVLVHRRSGDHVACLENFAARVVDWSQRAIEAKDGA